MFKDPWASLLSFSNWLIFINAHADVESMVVSDFITHNKEWDISLMANFVPDKMMTHIYRLSIAKFDWHEVLRQNYSKTIKLKGIYSLLNSECPINKMNIYWECKLEVLPRV